MGLQTAPDRNEFEYSEGLERVLLRFGTCLSVRAYEKCLKMVQCETTTSICVVLGVLCERASVCVA